MLRTRLLCALAALGLFLGLIGTVSAAEVDCDSVYCFSAGDFSPEEEIAGICITSLPDSRLGTVLLEGRVLRPGDILTAGQVAQMTFCPLRSEVDQSAEVGYLPIYADRVEAPAAMTIAIRGKEDKAPVAEDFALETYKNLPLDARLKVTDPEGQALVYTVTRQPKRGTVTIHEDGSFTYTPKKNKVGVDSFVYTATDPAGKVSREATVTITILKPTDSTQYTDTIGAECRFTAEWLKNTGIFAGETLAEKPCFQPDKTVTRGEFITMLVKALDIPTDETLTYTGYTDEVPGWLQPYLAAAMRSGLTAGLPEQETFGADTVITGAEVSVLLQNALDLTARGPADVDSMEDAAVPVWAQSALIAADDHGIALTAEEPLTRGQAAEVLYRAVKLAAEETVTE